MDNRPRVVHITAHMGGGIGKVLSRVAARAVAKAGYRHEIVCLEAPEKSAYIEFARDNGVCVGIAPPVDRIIDQCASAAVVHFDWWHHPAMARCMVATRWPPLRSVIWCHNSGHTPPIIPPKLVTLPDKCIFTTPYSYESPYLQPLWEKGYASATAMVHSSGGFDDAPERAVSPKGSFTVGYVGTLNFCKLHPEFLSFCAGAGLKDAGFLLVGDPMTRNALEEQARRLGILERVRFAGYVDPVVKALREIDVLAYILNPNHYGTTENALLEAMAYGIPPVILNQSAEKYLVRHGETGLAVSNKEEFGAALRYLRERPGERSRIGSNAREFVLRELSCEATVRRLHACYDDVMKLPKRIVDFSDVFGAVPADWFLSCLGRFRGCYEGRMTDELPADDGFAFSTESTKCSVYHYCRYFPLDKRLGAMARQTEALRGEIIANQRSSL